MYKYFKLTSKAAKTLRSASLNLLAPFIKRSKIRYNNSPESKSISDDWKKVGDDMRRGILKYDRSVTK
ncbi:hypothetical protein [Fructilactobacillus fructivorans]|uniref:Uncharacterized protein n=1 Tax=Fructilactobacillus fructivorans TaxID=1614 RepID=A0A0C1PRA1_9LACO|nr:hypothetical protein [Fructilactobacillus fructivorans]KID42411.1 hypothetical protein LfDm3_0340 [Fructilactobacillus fructivorans]MCT0150975.1 hypothetical protein [Fructilactobacillus fructivorans]MCT2867468.1 hypothetical protein [Fructilactobacillus fructivorans]MCT2869014.1 hypothetical protein [Fructilactobacillus fructivorans]MCT2873267.1 hypothetical protein [Fructilactobacillus fructivorans]